MPVCGRAASVSANRSAQQSVSPRREIGRTRRRPVSDGSPAVAIGGHFEAYEEVEMIAFLMWLALFILCWPVALAALLLYPVVWLLLLPFRLVGIAVGGVFEFLRALLALPARLLGYRRRRG